MKKREIRGKIVAAFGSQCVAAKKLGIPESRLSRLLNGHAAPRPEEDEVFRKRFGVNLREEIRAT